jgi:hypothetical protein
VTVNGPLFVEHVAYALHGKVIGDGFRACREVLRKTGMFVPPTATETNGHKASNYARA